MTFAEAKTLALQLLGDPEVAAKLRAALAGSSLVPDGLRCGVVDEKRRRCIYRERHDGDHLMVSRS